MDKKRDKVAVTPCAGVGQIFGPVVREAGYKLVEDMYPDETVLVCMPALAANIQEDIDFVNDYPVLVLNGCKDRCASKIVLDKGGQVDAEVYLPDILKQEKLSLHGEKRSKLGPKSQLAIDKMAERAGEVISALIQEGSKDEQVS